LNFVVKPHDEEGKHPAGQADKKENVHPAVPRPGTEGGPQRTGTCDNCGITKRYRFELAQCFFPTERFNLPQNPAIIAYTMLWAGFNSS